jgi:hypothetical protein
METKTEKKYLIPPFYAVGFMLWGLCCGVYAVGFKDQGMGMDDAVGVDNLDWETGLVV